MKVSQQYAESIRHPLTSRQIDRTGQRKGRLVFLHPTVERVVCGPIKWIAQCDCGNLTLCVPSNKLTMSCGCLRIDKSVEAGAAARRKLTSAEVVSIRNTLMSGKDCAAVFGVSRDTISSIKTGRRYKHVA